MNREHMTILLVEDNDDDFGATVRAFRRAHVANPIMRCVDGDETLDFLYRKGKYSDPVTSPRPGIILLDLNLPGTDGNEVLKEVKRDPLLCSIPVVVLTTSDNQRDIDKCYQFGANSYIVKPVNLQNFLSAVERIKDYWIDLALFPSIAEPFASEIA